MRTWRPKESQDQQRTHRKCDGCRGWNSVQHATQLRGVGAFTTTARDVCALRGPHHWRAANVAGVRGDA